jgi:hypothetical protein
MSRLSEVIAQVIEDQLTTDGTIVPARAALSALSMLEEEDIGLLASAELRRKFKEAMTTARKSADTSSKGQSSFPFPEIRLAHALDLESRMIKLTSEMSEIEFNRVIDIRVKSIKDDTAYLDKLLQARDELAPIWKARPDLTFAEACEVFVQMTERGAA